MPTLGKHGSVIDEMDEYMPDLSLSLSKGKSVQKPSQREDDDALNEGVVKYILR